MFEEEARQALLECLEELGSPWMVDDVECRAIQDSNTVGNTLTEAGFESDIEFSLTVLKTDFEGKPLIGKRAMNLRDRSEYRILRAITSEGDPGLQLECGSIDK